MPIYEYRCEACGEREEKLQAISAPNVHDCPFCGIAQGMRRQISRTSFALAGGGWYAQGYGSESPLAPKSTATPSEASSGASSKPAPACTGGCACH